jgi:hypothetical protein
VLGGPLRQGLMSATVGTFGPLRPPASLIENEHGNVRTWMAEEVPMPARVGPAWRQAGVAIEPGGMA